MKTSPLYTLDTLAVGEYGLVCKLPDDIDISHRLMSLGLVIGTKITAVNATIDGNIKAYFFRGAVIALRNPDAKTILIKKA